MLQVRAEPAESVIKNLGATLATAISDSLAGRCMLYVNSFPHLISQLRSAIYLCEAATTLVPREPATPKD